MHVCRIVSFADTNIVALRNPESMEAILRAEGKYPVRDAVVSNNIKWLAKNVAREESSFIIE
jgi:hypothetical protein